MTGTTASSINIRLKNPLSSLTQATCLISALAGIIVLTGCSTKPLSMYEVSPGLFTGRMPKSESDFATLRQHNIQTILTLQTMNFHVEPERKRAQLNRIAFVNVPVPATPWAPREEKVKEVLQIMAAPNLRPLYVHCLLGRDRTSVLTALYRVYYENCPPQQAWDEMVRRGGFKSTWSMFGFKVYYWNNCNIPDWARQNRPAVSSPGSAADKSPDPVGQAKPTAHSTTRADSSPSPGCEGQKNPERDFNAFPSRPANADARANGSFPFSDAAWTNFSNGFSRLGAQ